MAKIEKNTREYRSMERLHYDVFSLIEKMGVINTRMKFLDCACGTGVFSESLLQKYQCIQSNIFMVDIQELKIHLNGAHFIKTDINDPLPFEDSFFDLIVSLETIEHLLNPNSFLQELNRIMKKDGKLIISTPNIHNIFSRMLFLVTGELQWYRKWSVYDNGGHISPIYQPAFVLMLKRNNFRLMSNITTTGRVLGTGITFPLRGPFWGEISISVLAKV